MKNFKNLFKKKKKKNIYIYWHSWYRSNGGKIFGEVGYKRRHGSLSGRPKLKKKKKKILNT